MKRKIYKEIYSLPLFISTVVSFILSVFIIFFTSNITIPLWVLMLVITIFLFITWFILIARNPPLSTETDAHIERFVTINGVLCAVLSKNDSIIKGNYLTIFITIDKVEHYVATGRVDDIQNNGMIIVTLLHFPESYDYDIQTSSVVFIEKLIVKLSITKNYTDSFK